MAAGVRLPAIPAPGAQRAPMALLVVLLALLTTGTPRTLVPQNGHGR